MDRAGELGEVCVCGGCTRRLTLAPLSFCVAPSRTRQTVRLTPCELASTPNCLTQVFIVGGLPGHFRLGCESLKEWGRGGEAEALGSRGGVWLGALGGGRGGERPGAGIRELPRLRARAARAG